MYKKFLIILILDMFLLVNTTQTFAKYVFNYTLDVASVNTGGNYYLITYTEKDNTNEKIEKLYKGDNHDSNGQILRRWIMEKRFTLETIKIEDNSGNIKDCSRLFGGLSEVVVCHQLKKIDLSSFNTENVTDMSLMFYDCINLVDLNISNLNTSKVTDMSDMFRNCFSIETIDLRSFNTSNVTDMQCMFINCRSTKEIKVSIKWKTDNANMSDMFRDCGVSTLKLYNTI